MHRSKTLHGHTLHAGQILDPAVLLLIDDAFDDALVTSIRLLGLQSTAAGTHAAFGVVHSFLERVVLPAEYVVTVLAETCVVTSAEVERLGAISRPVCLVVELASIPNNL